MNNPKTDSPLYALLQKIRERPGLYLGRPSLKRLRHFICGYVFGALENNPDYCCFLEGFNGFTADYYKDQRTLDYAGLILAHTNSREEAFDKFFELLDEFIKTAG